MYSGDVEMRRSKDLRRHRRWFSADGRASPSGQEVLHLPPNTIQVNTVPKMNADVAISTCRT
jgi:hypothetical protein